MNGKSGAWRTRRRPSGLNSWKEKMEKLLAGSETRETRRSVLSIKMKLWNCTVGSKAGSIKFQIQIKFKHTNTHLHPQCRWPLPESFTPHLFACTSPPIWNRSFRLFSHSLIPIFGAYILTSPGHTIVSLVRPTSPTLFLLPLYCPIAQNLSVYL